MTGMPPPIYARNGAPARLRRALWCSWRHRWRDDPAAQLHAMRYGFNVPVRSLSRKACWACRENFCPDRPA